MTPVLTIDHGPLEIAVAQLVAESSSIEPLSTGIDFYGEEEARLASLVTEALESVQGDDQAVLALAPDLIALGMSLGSVSADPAFDGEGIADGLTAQVDVRLAGIGDEPGRIYITRAVWIDRPDRIIAELSPEQATLAQQITVFTEQVIALLNQRLSDDMAFFAELNRRAIEASADLPNEGRQG